MTQRIFSTVPADIGSRANIKDADGPLTREEILDVASKELGLDPNSDLVQRLASNTQRELEEKRKYMSGPGELDLPPRLEEKRWRYMIPDGAFKTQPLFDRILVFQIPTNEFETASEHSTIHLTEKSKSNEQKRSPRGIIVGMGMLAADELKSNGTDLGDTIHVILSNPWHRPLGRIGGKDVYLMVMRAGDLVDNEDLRERVRTGVCKIGVRTKENGQPQHVLKDENGELWYPEMPWITEDF